MAQKVLFENVTEFEQLLDFMNEFKRLMIKDGKRPKGKCGFITNVKMEVTPYSEETAQAILSADSDRN